MNTKQKSLFKIFLKIFSEIILLTILFFIIDIVSWWLFVWLGKMLAGCVLIDPGSFKEPIVNCNQSFPFSNFFEQFLQNFSLAISTPLFWLMIWLFFLTFPLNLFFVVTLSIILAFLVKRLLNDQKNEFKFPILLRIMVRKIEKLRKKR